MQITILSVAAKPQQFLKRLKKGFCFQIHIIFQPHPLSLEDRAGRIPTLVLVACWCFICLKPRAKSLSSSGEKQRWGQQEGWACWLGPRCAGFSGLEATKGGLLPLRCLMTGSGFICLSFSQRGW
ncbi:hypothetical protein mRhiFer1_009831 [Rhinolophus ferrumequinum]|uniref:Uncharacterized protein n=1 Tax=Rhinolophus ferrumequinum TaxID=59479 RepID=A0A7J7YST9_RHIFE|nr:hypothetical protein mRhiFer1_009831 [Rhinolophus ferrumequinum]